LPGCWPLLAFRFDAIVKREKDKEDMPDNFDDHTKSANLDGFVKYSRSRHETGGPLAGGLPLEQTKS